MYACVHQKMTILLHVHMRTCYLYAYNDPKICTRVTCRHVGMYARTCRHVAQICIRGTCGWQRGTCGSQRGTVLPSCNIHKHKLKMSRPPYPPQLCPPYPWNHPPWARIAAPQLPVSPVQAPGARMRSSCFRSPCLGRRNGTHQNRGGGVSALGGRLPRT
jgi:hypothetical protein